LQGGRRSSGRVNALSHKHRGENPAAHRLVRLTTTQNGWRADLEAAMDGADSFRAKPSSTLPDPGSSNCCAKSPDCMCGPGTAGQGEHIVVPRRIAATTPTYCRIKTAYCFPPAFERRFTLIGTTEVVLAQPPAAMEVSDEECAICVTQ